MVIKDNITRDSAELRKRAVTIAREKAVQSPENIDALSPDEIRQIFHELRVHQIELEMQNEELRLAQVELDASRTRYFDLYDLAPVGYCTLSEKGLILEANLTTATLIGVVRSALIKQPITRFICKEDQNIYYYHRKQLFETDKPQAFELRMVKYDGVSLRVHLEAIPAQDVDGTPLCRIALSDISQLMQTEDALRESENKFRLITENTADLISIQDMNLHFTYVGPAIMRLRGFTVEECMSQTLEQVLTPESMRIAVAVFEEEMILEASGTANFDRSRILELEEYKKDGSIVWMEVNFSFLRDKSSKPVSILSVSRDITERKNAEEKLRRYAHIVSNTQDTLLLLDKNFTYLSANAAFLLAFGKTSDEVIGRTQSDLFGETYFNTVIRPRAERCLAGENIRYQEWVEFPAAGRKYMDITYSPYLGPDGEINGFVVASRDITEQETLKEQLIQAQKMESVGRLAGGVAHDFNNMLNVIIGFAEIAMEKVAPEDSLQADLEEIVSAGRRSVGITRQLLAFARKQAIFPERIDLNETLESMLNMLRRLIGENIDLAFFPGSDLWLVLLDPSQVDQLLANLSVNARDAIADVGRVVIETKNVVIEKAFCADHFGIAPGNFVLLSVSDTGRGMDPETRDMIFEPFFTTKDRGKGTGLGLATVYGIVKQNNGFIYVDSEPGQGSTFRIYLPRCQRGKTETPEINIPEIAICQGETILIVEDELPVLGMARTMLENAGYTVLTADSPNKAICLAEQHAGRIHLLLTDVIMPEMNGRELAARLQKILPEIKCLFMSGYTADVIAHHGVLENNVNFLMKPFSGKGLMAKVQEVLGQQE